ncbi:MAG: alpha/beta hydrolase [Alphaproteobacteria bacterium]|nr:alpha/beta hydrolase [Alphaproteobacteria bacterium]
MEFQTKSVDLSRGAVQYHTAGEGPALLYLHPAAGFRPSGPIEQLASHFRLIAPIVPGFDGTDRLPGVDTVPAVADLYAEIISALADGACDVVGQSLGAWIGAWLAVSHPETVEPLILASPAGFRPPHAPPLSFKPEVMLRQLYAHPEKRPPETKTAEQIAGNREAIKHYGIGAAWDEELNRRIGEIRCLTLIVHGTKDVRVPVDAVRKLRHEIPHSHLVFVYDAAHSIEIDQPERVGALYTDFLWRGEAFIVNPGSGTEAA